MWSPGSSDLTLARKRVLQMRVHPQSLMCSLTRSFICYAVSQGSPLPCQVVWKPGGC